MIALRMFLIAGLAVVCTVPPAAAEQPQSLEELTAGFAAKVLASAVFVSERDTDEALANSIIPFLIQGGARAEDLVDVQVDRAAGEVRVTIGETTRTARSYGDQGCVLLPIGETDVFFEPVDVAPSMPDADSTPWPMGDVVEEVRDGGVDAAKLDAALELAFQPENHTVGLAVVHDGQIVAERYGEGADLTRKSESWSMGKSLTAMLYGRLVNDQGPFDPFVPAPFPEWQGDARNAIQVADLFRMSSGLRFSSRENPPSTWDHAHPDHTLVYSGAIDVFAFSLTRPLEHEPNTVGRYRNCDPLLVGLIIQRAVEAQGENYLAWPQRVLFDKLGIRNIVLEPDPYGNFVMTGFEYGSARDWARLGMLMEQDGVWQGERLLPEGFVEFVSTPAPAWKNGAYGGLFWVNTNGRWGLPEDAYRMAGHGGQHVTIVPSHDLVIVRMGHLRGARDFARVEDEMNALIAAAVDQRERTDKLR